MTIPEIIKENRELRQENVSLKNEVSRLQALLKKYKGENNE